MQIVQQSKTRKTPDGQQNTSIPTIQAEQTSSTSSEDQEDLPVPGSNNLSISV